MTADERDRLVAVAVAVWQGDTEAVGPLFDLVEEVGLPGCEEALRDYHLRGAAAVVHAALGVRHGRWDIPAPEGCRACRLLGRLGAPASDWRT